MPGVVPKCRHGPHPGPPPGIDRGGPPARRVRGVVNTTLHRRTTIIQYTILFLFGPVFPPGVLLSVFVLDKFRLDYIKFLKGRIQMSPHPSNLSGYIYLFVGAATSGHRTRDVVPEHVGAEDNPGVGWTRNMWARITIGSFPLLDFSERHR